MGAITVEELTESLTKSTRDSKLSKSQATPSWKGLLNAVEYPKDEQNLRRILANKEHVFSIEERRSVTDNVFQGIPDDLRS